MTTRPTLRCAIYTRKSTEEGLEQAFNSLDAQHEACAAYIASQRHEGWTLTSERFDDGGLSGGTLDRPALQRLLAAIEAGRIGMVVVYKIDRLTRSLADFARLVERLEARGCSFVSVTQAFNTSSSMGRLTLNVLLSFAQFEREVTAERIRDKIAASKKRGLWMGGTLPLGYDRPPDPQLRQLVVNPAEAVTVQRLFGLYAELGNLRLVEQAAATLGLRPKPRPEPSRSSTPFTRGQLQYLLTNPVYLGRIRHRDQSYPAAHPAIIDSELWDCVQQQLLAARARPRGRNLASVAPKMLTGRIRDEIGDLLTPTHTQRRGRRFDYYISHRLIAGGKDATGWRLPARHLEAIVCRLVANHLRDAATSQRLLAAPDAESAACLTERVSGFLTEMEATPDQLVRLIARIDLAAGAIHIRLQAEALAERLGLATDDLAPEVLRVSSPFPLARRGVEARIMAGSVEPAPDDRLIRLLAAARSWARALREGTLLATLVRTTGHSEPYLRARLPLAFLSPKLQQMILEGRQPSDLTAARLIREGVPLDWANQEAQFSAPAKRAGT